MSQLWQGFCLAGVRLERPEVFVPFQDTSVRTKQQILARVRGSSAELAESVPADAEFGVLALDDRNDVIFWDEQCKALFGWTSPEMAHKNVSILLKSGLSGETGQFLRPPGPGGSNKCAMRITARRKDKTEFPALLVKTPGQKNSTFLWMAVFPATEEAVKKPEAAAPQATPSRAKETQPVVAAAPVTFTPPEPPVAKPLPQQPPPLPPPPPLPTTPVNPAPAPEPVAALTTEADKLRETLDTYDQERKELTEQASSYYVELQSVRTQLIEEREARQQLEEKLKDVMSAGIQQARGQIQGKPGSADKPGAEANRARATDSKEPSEAELRSLRDRDAAHQPELAEAERRVRDGVAALARVTTEVEIERSERRRLEERATALAGQVETMHGELRRHLESERTTQAKTFQLETQLRERETVVTNLQADLQKVRTDLGLAEEQLKATAEVSKQFQESLRLMQETKEIFQRTERDLTTRLDAAAKQLADSQSKLEKESTEREQLAKDVEGLQRQIQRQTEESALEISRLQSAVQAERLERKQLEGSNAQARYVTLDSARADRVLLNQLRTRMVGPLDELLRCTRSLLDAKEQEQRKKLVETALEQALLLKSNFQDGSSNGESQPVAATPSSQPQAIAA